MYSTHVFANGTDTLSQTEPNPALVEDERLVQLLLQQTGYAPWKIVFPGSVMLSAEASSLFGLPRSDDPLPLEALVQLYHPDDRGKLLSMIAQSLDGRRGFHCRLRVVSPDGATRMIETIADLRVRDERVIGLFGASRDATAVVDKELSNLVRLRLIQEMVNDMPSPVAMVDERLRVMDCSITWLKAHRFIEKREVVGKTLPVLFGGLPGDIAAEYDRALKGMTIKTKRNYLNPSTNQQVQCNAVISPWFVSERRVGGLIIAVGWSDLLLAKSLPPPPPPVEEFEGSLLDMLKSVTS